jgi:hypothetical protein
MSAELRKCENQLHRVATFTGKPGKLGETINGKEKVGD